VAINFYLWKDVRYLAITVDDIRCPYNSHRFLSIEVLFLPHAISFQGLVGGVAGQGEIQLVLGLELLKRFDAVATHPQDSCAQLVQFFFGVTELVRLTGSTRGVGFGEEIEDQGVPLEIFQAHVCTRI